MKKVMSCILSFVPLILFGLAMLSIIFLSLFASDPMSTFETILAILMVVEAFAAVIACYGVMIWYIVKACKNPYISVGIKVLWCFMLYFINVLIFPVFWFIYIRNE